VAGEFDTGPVHLGPLAAERHRPVSTRRKKVGTDIRVDATRVSGPIRIVLEPLLWVTFVIGVMWLLITVEPVVRAPAAHGLVIHQYAGPFALVIGGFLVLSTISALLWLPGSTSAARSRTAMSGLGMIASGWLFSNLHPVRTEDFQFHAWFCIAVGVLLVAICAVPWPTRPAVEPGALTGLRTTLVAVLVLACLGVGVLAWQQTGPDLVGAGPEMQQAWRDVLPLLVAMVLLLATTRHVIRRPAPDQEQLFVDAS
jgi:hypothetical protein